MSTPNTIQIPKPELRDDEQWIGSVIFKKNTLLRHIILLPGDNEPENHRRQEEWAKDIGGELPDRIAGALLFAEAKNEFKPEIYWLSETFAEDSDWAWDQDFSNGYQDFSLKGDRLRARAVRSEFLTISH